jgi:hypothetical protein
MANTICNGSTQELAENINQALQAVTSDMTPITSGDNFCIDQDLSVPDKFTISLEETQKVLRRVKSNKAGGPDLIPNWLLNNAALSMAVPVCAMWNSSIREGHVPSLWKTADICPIGKIPRPMRIDKDLRPISLTPVLSKSLELFTRGWVMETMVDILDEHQFGSLKGCSTTLALIEMYHLWLEALEDTGSVVRILFLDFKKAFDRVDHTILLTKLANLGLPSILIKWITSFLCMRRQRVKVGKVRSAWSHVTAGVPQGTLLGPTAFLLHINCLRTKCHSVKYVDDATIWNKCGRNSENCELQEAADQAQEWADSNQMQINTDKTKTMEVYFGKKQTNLEAISMNSCNIDKVSTFKALGVILNNKLTWHDHVEYMVKKTSKRLYLLVLLKRSGLSNEDIAQVYTSTIRSVLEYAAELWHPGLTKEQSAKLEHIQCRALHIILPNSNYSEACSTLGIDTLHMRRVEKCKKLFINIQSEHHKLHYMLPNMKQSRNLRGNKLYNLPKTKTKRFANSPINYLIFNCQ